MVVFERERKMPTVFEPMYSRPACAYVHGAGRWSGTGKREDVRFNICSSILVDQPTLPRQQKRIQPPSPRFKHPICKFVVQRDWQENCTRCRTCLPHWWKVCPRRLNRRVAMLWNMIVMRRCFTSKLILITEPFDHNCVNVNTPSWEARKYAGIGSYASVLKMLPSVHPTSLSRQVDCSPG